MRTIDPSNLAPSTLLDPLDSGDPLEGEAFDRFDERMDEALERLEARWLGLAAPAARATVRTSCLFGGSAGVARNRHSDKLTR